MCLSLNKYVFVASEVLWPSLQPVQHNSQISLRFTFIGAAFKSHTGRSNAQHISAPQPWYYQVQYLPFCGFTCFATRLQVPTSYIEPLYKQRKTRRYIKINLYFYSLTATIICHRNTVRESSHISFFCDWDPFCEVVRQPKNTHTRCWQVCLSNQWVTPFA